MTQIPELSPGCFGSALGFRATDMICRKCSFATECIPVHLLVKRQLCEKFGIVTKSPPRAVIIAPAPIAPAPLVLPKKLQTVLDRLNNFGFDIISKLAHGQNPFDRSMPGLWVACAMLTRMEIPITRDLLVLALRRKLNWQEDQAREAASIALYALLHVGAVQSVAGKYSLKKVNQCTQS